MNNVRERYSLNERIFSLFATISIQRLDFRSIKAVIY
jgi:hypothetical protein